LNPPNVEENNRSAEADPAPDPAWEVRSVLEDRGLYWLLHPPRVAIVGVPNVGKSTVANQLFAQERSITADLPGTTRDWVGEIANIDGLAVMLVDTPGVRQTQDAIEREAIERSREQVGAADLVVMVLDATRDLSEQRDLLAAYPSALCVMNKVDRPKTWEVPDGGAWIQTVATTGSGVDRLRDAIKRQFLGTGPFDVNQPRWWTRRQREILELGLKDPSALESVVAQPRRGARM